MINPDSITDDEFRSVFTDKNEWMVISYNDAIVCNLLRFETMRSSKVSIEVIQRRSVAA